MWVEKYFTCFPSFVTQSSSLWGCELKSCIDRQIGKRNRSSSLWGCELKNPSFLKESIAQSHPPCEDVSWKKIVDHMECWINGHPPCEDVSWKSSMSSSRLSCSCHPPCEDVSWKVWDIFRMCGASVILLVRMWVEKYTYPKKITHNMSSSLWGCELKSELKSTDNASYRSSSLWGCELKSIA